MKSKIVTGGGTSKRDNFNGGNNERLSDEEVRLLDCLVSSIDSIEPNRPKSGSTTGQRKEGEKIWDVVYTVSQANDGTSTFETSLATQFKFTAINKIVQSTAGNQPEDAVSSSMALSCDVERKNSLAGFPYLVSTGTSLATSRSSGAISAENNENDSGNRDIKGVTQPRGGAITNKCRIGLKLSFSSMKYLGFLTQVAASSADADSTVELIGIASDKDGKNITHYIS